MKTLSKFFFIIFLTSGFALVYFYLNDSDMKHTINSNSEILIKGYDSHGYVEDPQYFDENPQYFDVNIQDISNKDVKDAQKNINYLKGNVVGTIEIPSLKIKLPIFEGISKAKLAVGVGTMKPNQRLGEGNFALAGHNMDTTKNVLFSRLPKINNNEKVIVNYKNQKVTYIVKYIEKIEPTASDRISDQDIDPGSKAALTLITCADYGKNRYLVRAVI